MMRDRFIGPPDSFWGIESHVTSSHMLLQKNTESARAVGLLSGGDKILSLCSNIKSLDSKDGSMDLGKGN